jgi:hypothetical protein
VSLDDDTSADKVFDKEERLTFEPRSSLLPTYGWCPVSDRTFLNSQSETLEMLKSVTESKTDAVNCVVVGTESDKMFKRGYCCCLFPDFENMYF